MASVFKLNVNVLHCCQKDSSKNKGNLSYLNPLVRVCEKGSHVQVCPCSSNIVSEDEVAGCVSTVFLSVVTFLLLFHFHGGEHYLRFDAAACEPFVRLFLEANLKPSLRVAALTGVGLSQASLVRL